MKINVPSVGNVYVEYHQLKNENKLSLSSFDKLCVKYIVINSNLNSLVTDIVLHSLIFSNACLFHHRAALFSWPVVCTHDNFVYAIQFDIHLYCIFYIVYKHT